MGGCLPPWLQLLEPMVPLALMVGWGKPGLLKLGVMNILTGRSLQEIWKHCGVGRRAGDWWVPEASIAGI